MKWLGGGGGVEWLEGGMVGGGGGVEWLNGRG